MESAQGLMRPRDTPLRNALILLVAIGASLPMAWLSLGKLGLIAFGLYALLNSHVYEQCWKSALTPWAMRILVISTLAFALSMLWTVVPIAHAVHTWLKHAKLLSVLLLILLLDTPQRAAMAVRWLIWGQAAIVFLSWMLVAGFSWPGHTPERGAVVFAESYIDQSAMFCISAALAWHFRGERLWPTWLQWFVVAGAICSVLFVLPGRTGYLMLVALLSAATFWAIPRRWRWVSMAIAPIFFIVLLWTISPNTKSGLERVATETIQFSHQVETQSSSGWRLNAWHHSLKAIAHQPLMGYGVGSFVPAVKSIAQGNSDAEFGNSLSSNPHQEFLLWGVELGVSGVFLLVGLLWYLAHWAHSFPPSSKRAVTSVILAIFVACLFNSALYDDLIGDFLCFALGISLAYGRLATSRNTEPT